MGEPEQRVHYHTEAVTEVVPVSLHARLSDSTPRTRYTVNRNTREVTPDHFDTPLVEHYQARTAHNLNGHVDNAYDEYYHHDPIQDDRLGGEIHTFHESLADFFPDGQDHFDVPLNLQYEGDSGANVWFPMEEGENWLQPRGRRVE